MHDERSVAIWSPSVFTHCAVRQFAIRQRRVVDRLAGIDGLVRLEFEREIDRLQWPGEQVRGALLLMRTVSRWPTCGGVAASIVSVHVFGVSLMTSWIVTDLYRTLTGCIVEPEDASTSRGRAQDGRHVVQAEPEPVADERVLIIRGRRHYDNLVERMTERVMWSATRRAMFALGVDDVERVVHGDAGARSG